MNVPRRVSRKFLKNVEFVAPNPHNFQPTYYKGFVMGLDGRYDPENIRLDVVVDNGNKTKRHMSVPFKDCKVVK